MKKSVLVISFILFLFGSNVYSHQIDDTEDRCFASASTDSVRTECVRTAQKSWQEEIDSNLSHLKVLMDKNDFKSIEKSQKSWEKFKKEEFGLIEKVTGSTNSYLCESLKKDIFKERAFTLLGYTQVILDSNDN